MGPWISNLQHSSGQIYPSMMVSCTGSTHPELAFPHFCSRPFNTASVRHKLDGETVICRFIQKGYFCELVFYIGYKF
ncbi:unnamed protein product [Schistosoma turkestanicum]|nr:unnamed protein product [Schistosoma turkestanicum]